MFTATIQINPKLVANLFGTGAEVNYSSWIHAMHSPEWKLTDPEQKWWYYDPAWFDNPDFSCEIRFDSADDDEGAGTGLKTVKQDDIQRALDLMANHSPHNFSNVVQDNCDAEDADIFYQYLLLGEIVYG